MDGYTPSDLELAMYLGTVPNFICQFIVTECEFANPNFGFEPTDNCSYCSSSTLTGTEVFTELSSISTYVSATTTEVHPKLQTREGLF